MSVQITYPGVYVQELPSGTHTITGTPTSITGFIGYLQHGPLETPVHLLDFGDFQRTFGGLDSASDTSFQVSQFFLNGGTECWVSRCVASDGSPPTGFDIAGNSDARTGIYAFDQVAQINLLCAPDLRSMATSDYLTAATAILNYALQRKAFAILDLPATVDTVPLAEQWMMSTPASFGPGVISAASYFPEVQVPDPFATQPRQIGPSGTMAGIYALTDVTRGVWKAPAGISAALAGVQQLAYVMNDQENGVLNPLGLNALRTFPTYGSIAWGARTLASANAADDDWKYLNVRRLTLYMEQSLIQGLQWVVFEPNDESLWAQIRLTINSFLHPLFLQGAFVGATPDQAYQVICDASTTTPENMDNGIVNILILFAPVKPAEFVVLSLQQMTGQSSR